ncbi:hypothetical protein JCM24511_07167 [Saitozyma sp. JCM 24511]|nr:hypothetical protein JCM24511_07167 [Saitozyma sp. JCM 24511]
MSEQFLIERRGRWSYTTPFLFYACMVAAMGDLIYGYDVGLFGNLQALPSFLNRFGETINGTKALSSHTTAVINSIIFLGKGVASLCFEPTVERLGFKWTLFILCGVQCLGAIIELASHNWQGFVSGRVLTYFAVGFCETAVPTHASELAPAPVRAFFSGSIAFWLGLGSLWGSLMSRGFLNTQADYGWQIPVAISMVPAVVMAALLPWALESPRWLISHGQRDRALAILDRLRPEIDVDAGHTVMEIDAIEQAIAESKIADNGSWLDMLGLLTQDNSFRGTYFRRSMIAAWIFILQQISGNAFLASYATTFYKELGFGNNSFMYTNISSAAVVAITIPCLLLYDRIGRRPIMIVGSFLMIPGLLIVAILGSKSTHSSSEVGAIVFSVILYSCAVKVAFSTPCYMVASEIGGVMMRKKIMTFAACWDVISAFVNNYSVPYLLNKPGAGLGAKVGYIFAAISICAFLFTVFFVPELKGRSLEEVDELFELRLRAWQFTKAETHGAGARIAALEGSHALAIDSDKIHGRTDVKDTGEREEQATNVVHEVS